MAAGTAAVLRIMTCPSGCAVSFSYSRLLKNYPGTLRGAELSAPPQSLPNNFNDLSEGTRSAELKLRPP